MTQRYEPIEVDEERHLLRQMLELVPERPRFGYRRITKLLRRKGWSAHVKRVHRLWKQERLNAPRSQRKSGRSGM
ncbi:MAG: transposase [Planctomycetes bacterium]|nr:transposase [Planctomycetota bacterium]